MNFGTAFIKFADRALCRAGARLFLVYIRPANGFGVYGAWGCGGDCRCSFDFSNQRWRWNQLAWGRAASVALPDSGHLVFLPSWKNAWGLTDRRSRHQVRLAVSDRQRRLLKCFITIERFPFITWSPHYWNWGYSCSFVLPSTYTKITWITLLKPVRRRYLRDASNIP